MIYSGAGTVGRCMVLAVSLAPSQNGHLKPPAQFLLSLSPFLPLSLYRSLFTLLSSSSLSYHGICLSPCPSPLPLLYSHITSVCTPYSPALDRPSAVMGFFLCGRFKRPRKPSTAPTLASPPSASPALPPETPVADQLVPAEQPLSIRPEDPEGMKLHDLLRVIRF